MRSERIDEVPALVTRLYEIVDELEAVFPGRHFTPDGHLVGSIGEGLAAHLFDLELVPASNEGYDATTSDGLTVEVKTTQRSGVGLASDVEEYPDRLLVLSLDERGRCQVVYNGPARPAWERAGKPQKTGQRRVSLAALRELDARVPPELRLVQSGSLEGDA